MDALQYIYTSWKNGDSTEKGYMIYSRSEGISEAECSAIKDAMQYLAPKELNLTPTAQEIADVFPYAFSCFILPTGRGCTAQSTYLGRDYSGRFGNYIIYALVYDPEDLPCRSAEFFGEPFIKTAMTEEELNAPSPVPPLPPLRITQYGSVINDEQLNEFVFSREDEFSQVIAMMLAARDAGVPFYLNDTRENLVLWAAAIQRILPPRLARNFAFNTYIGNHEAMRSPKMRSEGLDFHLIGVRPDANYFNYATECKSSRQMVMDFLGGHMTEGVEPSDFSRAMASSLAMDCEEAGAFGEFVDGTSFREINGRLQDAYLCFQLLRFDAFEFTESNLKAILSFGSQYCSDADNADIGGKLLVKFQENGWALGADMLAGFWSFACRYADFMIFTLFDLFQETVYQLSGDAAGPCTELGALVRKIQKSSPSHYHAYLEYLNSDTSVEQMLLYLAGHKNLYTNSFYIHWLLQSYPFSNGLNDRQPVSKLLVTLLNNLTRIDGSEKSMVEILFAAAGRRVLFGQILQVFMCVIRDTDRLEKLCEQYVEASEGLSEEQLNLFERLFMEMPEAAPIAARLCARKIASSKRPEDEFWRIYKHQKNTFASNTGVTIDPMVLACLQNLNESDREVAAINMMLDLDTSLLGDPEVIRILTDILNDCSVKTLMKLSRALLRRTCQLRARAEIPGLEKIKAVYFGEELQLHSKPDKQEEGLFQEAARQGISLASFNRTDYEMYVKSCFDAFFAWIQRAGDIAPLMQFFYHPRLFPEFTGEYVSALKKLEKREKARQRQVISWTCGYLAAAGKSDPAAGELQKPMIRFLRTLDEEELEELRQTTAREVPGADCGNLFEEVRRKEGLSEKLGGLFHRK